MSVVRLVPDAIKKERAKKLRRCIFENCRKFTNECGDEILGFALVVWDGNGDTWTSYKAEVGPIGPRLVPALVSDALNQHVAVNLAKASE